MEVQNNEQVDSKSADTSDTANTSDTQQVETQNSSHEMVSRKEFNKVLDDMHNFKKLYKESQTQLKDREMDELKNKEEWQKIAQIKEDEARKAREDADKLKDSVVFEKKYSALKDAAIKAGLRKEALADLELLGMDELAIETTSTGRVNVLGAETLVQRLKNDRPHWFGGRSGNVNTDSPEVVQSGSGKITMDQIYKAQKKAEKSGDYAAYEKLILEYKRQQ